MNLQDLRQKLNEVGFSPEVAAKLNEILDQATVKGSLDETAKQQMMNLIDLDIEAGVLEANTMEEMALTLDAFADENKNVLAMADEAEAEVEAEVEEKLEKVEGTAKQAVPTQTPMSAVQSPAVPTL